LEKLGQKLRWNQWPEYGKTGFLVLLIIGVTLGGYGIFTVAMGTSSPLVVVTSDSMSPTLERGHLLVLQKQQRISMLVISLYTTLIGTLRPLLYTVLFNETMLMENTDIILKGITIISQTHSIGSTMTLLEL
jgi:hypothetical protein